MVEDNICHMLNNFLKCSEFDNIIFCWVMHQQVIMDNLLSRLDTHDTKVFRFSLTCSDAALTQRLANDVASGVREADIVARSLARLSRPSILLLFPRQDIYFTAGASSCK